MQVRVVTLRYDDGLQGFGEEPLRQAMAGREVLAAREYFFVHGNQPHLTVVLELSDSPGASSGSRGSQRSGRRPDPGKELPSHLQGLYRDLRQWRNQRAKDEGIPSYVILRNRQLAEICRRLPRSVAALQEIDGVGEGTTGKYGKDILALIPAELSAEEIKSADPPVDRSAKDRDDKDTSGAT